MRALVNHLDAPPAQGPDRLPLWRLRVALYILMALAASAALVVEPALAGAVQRGAVSPNWLFLPVGIFAVFMGFFALDRVWLVRVRRYPAGRAVFQIAFGVLFAFLLLPSRVGDFRSRPATGKALLLSSPDPNVRQMSLKALGFDPPTKASVEAVAGALDDPNLEVRRTAAQVLGRWSGTTAEDISGVRAWASAFFAGTAAVAPLGRIDSADTASAGVSRDR